MQEWKLFLFFMGILFAPAIQAQKLDSTLAIYRSDFQTEKVHLQLALILLIFSNNKKNEKATSQKNEIWYHP